MHAGDVAVTDADGTVLAYAGAPGRLVFARSCMKPVQAAVSLSLCSLSLPDTEVAVMCASHNAEAVHVDTVRSLLSRAGVAESALQCPSVPPWDQQTVRAAPEPARINSDCSGKHAGMLAACRSQGWPLATYLQADHPLQQAVLETVLRASRGSTTAVGTDGCGVPVHGMPLASMAAIYACLASPERLDDVGKHAGRAVEAMLAEPYLVAGRKRVDTAIMGRTKGVLVKGGAEGLICATLLERGIGVAVKIRDGSSRATGPALINVLRSLGALSDESLEALRPFVRPPVLGGGEQVGELVAEFQLER